LAASSKGPKLNSLLAGGKAAAAWKLCQKIQSKGPFNYDDELEACAEADYQRLVNLYPGGLDLDTLNTHWARWNGTPAAARTRDMAARKRLQAAGDDIDMLSAINEAFEDTEAGQEAMDHIFKLHEDPGTSAALKAFLERWPDVPHAAQARIQYEVMVWEEFEAVGTAAGWLEFQQDNPEHPRLKEAQRWEQTLAYREAEAAASAAAWGAFLQQYPDHPRYQQAEQNRINALFQEAEEQGPEAMLAVADAFSDHAMAPLTRANALRLMVKVDLFSAGHSEPDWSPVEGNETPAKEVPIGIDGVDISFPEGEEIPPVKLAFFDAGRASELGGGYAQLLTGMGFSRQQVKTMTQVNWLPPQGQKVVGRLQAPLCLPQDRNAWFAVVTEAFGQELVYPFKVGLDCATVQR